VKLRLAAALVAALALPGVAHAAARVTVTPAEALVDAPVDVRVTGLAPLAAVTLQATARDWAGKLWRARLDVRADDHGVFDTHSSMRVFWSMRRLQGSSAGGFLPTLGRARVDVGVIRAGRLVAQGSFVRRGAAAGVTAITARLADQGFVGTFFQPLRGAAPAPAVLVLGGSLGGSSYYPASLLASHGYPSLALAYFNEPGLPKTLKEIPLEYFQKALFWLASQPGVDPKRIVILGASRGAEAALLLGSTYPDLVHGVIAGSPSDQVTGAYPGPGRAWTLGGKPVPYGAIPVEKIAGPVLAFAGGRDEVWGSGPAVDRLIARARAHGRRDVVGVVYPGAGAGVVSVPNLPSLGLVEVRPGTTAELGGTPAANARAHASSWARILRFLGSL